MKDLVNSLSELISNFDEARARLALGVRQRSTSASAHVDFYK